MSDGHDGPPPAHPEDPAQPAATNAPGVLRVAQINIGSLLEPEWARRRHEIVAWLDRLDADVVCIEEAWESNGAPDPANTAGWLAEHAAAGYHWHFAGAPFADTHWPDPSLHFGEAVLSRWPIDAAFHHLLPTHGNDPWVRGVPWGLLHVCTAGLDVFVCHLAPAPSHGLHRRVQVAAIDRLVRDARGHADDSPFDGSVHAPMPAILAGDFNAEPDSDEIRFLCGLTPLEGQTTFWQDAWRVAGDGPGYSQDWRDNPIAAGLNVHRKRIDYVFVGDPFRRPEGGGRVLSVETAFHPPITGIVASDHRGLVVDIAWPTRPTEPRSRP